MNRPLQLLLFFAIALSLTAALHHYAWVRLVRDTGLVGPARTGATFFLWGLFGLLALSLPLVRLLGIQRSVASPLMWVVYTWMGTLLLLTLTLLLFEAVRIVWWLLPGTPPDPARRQALARFLALSTTTITGLAAGLAMRSALSRVGVRGLTIALPRLPRALSGTRVVQLTDLHIGPTIDGAWLEEVVRTVNALSPDLIAITGDLVDGTVERLAEHVAPLGGLRARHGVFFVTGNHEYYSGADAWIAELRRLGLQVLRNERVTLSGPEGTAIDIAGVDDHHSHGWPGHGPDFERALGGREPERPVLLLAHQPLAIFQAASYGVDLQLSGHTHGGQIWPWRYLVYLQQPYVAGLHLHPGSQTQIYVSNGTGYWGPPMRLLSDAEITHITLRST